MQSKLSTFLLMFAILSLMSSVGSFNIIRYNSFYLMISLEKHNWQILLTICSCMSFHMHQKAGFILAISKPSNLLIIIPHQYSSRHCI